jgi:hypothetical protein
MNQFIAKFSEQIEGALTGFDRLVFHGTLRAIAYELGMKSYLYHSGVLLKEFGQHVEQTSRALKAASLQAAQRSGRPVQFLRSSHSSKEELARQIAARDGIDTGLVCVFTSVEPCWSYEIVSRRATQKLDLKATWRKCLYIYQYWQHPVLGFLHARIQSWFPFSIQICLNGREWLARQMDAAGLEYVRQDNCFVWIEDYCRAQKLMDQQLETNWQQLLAGIGQQLNPAHAQIFAHYPVNYYWTTYQSEWAQDMVFRPAEPLRQLYPKLVRLGITSFSSSDVLRFLGKKTTREGTAPASLTAGVNSSLKRRVEGIRIKHSLGINSVKLYDKAYTEQRAVLRAEVTINAAEQFRVYRRKEGHPSGPRQWLSMRRGIADLHRRAEVSQQALDRYCDALASVDDSSTLEELTQCLERRVRWNHQWVRALHPFESADAALLQAVNAAEFTLHGLRNRDLQARLYPSPPLTAPEKRRRSGAISRKLRLLRAHGLIQKLAHTHRYQVTEKGRLILTTLLAARHTTLKQITAQAAA